MNARALTVLLVESRDLLAPILRETLAGVLGAGDRVLTATDLAGAMTVVRSQPVDIVLVDHDGDARQAQAAVRTVRAQAPELPLVLITEQEDDPAGAAALSEGADDHVSRGHLHNALLSRSLRYTVDRRKLQQTLRELSLNDDVTGLYNVRGFVALAEHHVRLASRTRGLLIGSFQAPLSDLPAAGGSAELLRACADLLRAVFRGSDVLARVGEKEFAVLAVDAPPATVEIIERRLAQLSIGSGNPDGLTMTGIIEPADVLGGADALLAQLDRMRNERHRIDARARSK